jgi:hypothetical protein
MPPHATSNNTQIQQQRTTATTARTDVVVCLAAAALALCGREAHALRAAAREVADVVALIKHGVRGVVRAVTQLGGDKRLSTHLRTVSKSAGQDASTACLKGL